MIAHFSNVVDWLEHQVARLRGADLGHYDVEVESDICTVQHREQCDRGLSRMITRNAMTQNFTRGDTDVF